MEKSSFASGAEQGKMLCPLSSAGEAGPGKLCLVWTSPQFKRVVKEPNRSHEGLRMETDVLQRDSGDKSSIRGAL